MRKISHVQLLGLIGAGLVLFASTRAWSTVDLSATTGPALHLRFTGRKLDALPSALATLSIVLLLVLGSTRNSVRRVFGVLLVAGGMGTIVVSVSTLSPTDLIKESIADSIGTYADTYNVNGTHWSVVSVFGALMIVSAGFILTIRTFPERVKTSKYDRAPLEDAYTDWQSLDHGIDPTVSDRPALD